MVTWQSDPQIIFQIRLQTLMKLVSQAKYPSEIYQLARDQALVKKLKKQKIEAFLFMPSRDNLILRSDYRRWWSLSVKRN
jgi:hypothetical protein